MRGDTSTWEYTRKRFAIHVASGLRYLHHDCKKAIIHRDIKPENILVGERMFAKLADFGLSTQYDIREARVRNLEALTMTPVGTEVYCAPEILRRERYNESVASMRARTVI